MNVNFQIMKVIHTLAKEGFKDMPMTNVTNVYVDAGGKRKWAQLRHFADAGETDLCDYVSGSL